MKFAEPIELYRKSGMWGTRGLLEGVESARVSWFSEPGLEGTEFKAFVGLCPFFFGPGTLWRTWGTRPVPYLSFEVQSL